MIKKIVPILLFLILTSHKTLLSSDTPWLDAYRQAGEFILQGKYGKGIEFSRRALKLAEEQFGFEHVNVALSKNLLAHYYFLEGDFSKARSLAEESRKLAGDIPNILTNLAIIYTEQGKFAEAEQISRKAIQLAKEQFGLEDPEVAEALNTLGEIYRTQGRYREAIPLYEEALQIQQGHFGKSHVNVALILANLGSTYGGLGDYHRAANYLKEASSQIQLNFHPNHPYVANSYRELGKFYMKEGNFHLAQFYLKRALAIQEKVLRQDHPETGGTLARLGQLYRSQMKYEEAKAYYQKSLEVFGKIYEPESPYVQAIRRELELLDQKMRETKTVDVSP